jgi:hypothetical protein
MLDLSYNPYICSVKNLFLFVYLYQIKRIRRHFYHYKSIVVNKNVEKNNNNKLILL